jgi:hypothetical protein
MYVSQNIETHSFSHCCSGKAIGITYSECLFVDLGIQLCHIDNRGLSDSTNVLHISS